MTSSSAMQWISEHRKEIIEHAEHFCELAPYEPEDCVSAAREAAMIAVNRLKGNSDQFEREFWEQYDLTLNSFMIKA